MTYPEGFRKLDATLLAKTNALVRKVNWFLWRREVLGTWATSYTLYDGVPGDGTFMAVAQRDILDGKRWEAYAHKMHARGYEVAIDADQRKGRDKLVLTIKRAS